MRPMDPAAGGLGELNFGGNCNNAVALRSQGNDYVYIYVSRVRPWGAKVTPPREPLPPPSRDGKKRNSHLGLGAGGCVQQVRGLEYGLVQKQGGPCGILAAVQALLLAELAEVGGG
jgi:hypothetical protein